MGLFAVEFCKKFPDWIDFFRRSDVTADHVKPVFHIARPGRDQRTGDAEMCFPVVAGTQTAVWTREIFASAGKHPLHQRCFQNADGEPDRAFDHGNVVGRGIDVNFLLRSISASSEVTKNVPIWTPL